MIESISIRIGYYVANKAGYLKDIDTVTYGCEIVIRSVIKILIISLISLQLGVFYETWTVIIFSALLRSFSGGVHCSTYTNCILTSTLIFSVMGLLVKTVALYLTPSGIMVFLILSTLVLCCVWVFWIPAGSDNRPLKNIDKKTYKVYSLIVIGFHFCVSISILYFLQIPELTVFVFSSIIGMLWQGFTVSPFGYHMITNFDCILKKLKGGIRRHV